MLYLIKEIGNEQDGNLTEILKIGFSDNVDNRIRSYASHYPFVKKLAVREGDEFMEKFLHLYFNEYKYPELEEWFYYNDEIVDKFNSVEFTKEWCEKIDSKLLIRFIFTNKDARPYLEKFLSLGILKEEILLYTGESFFETAEELIDNLDVFNRYEKRLKVICEFIKSNPDQYDQVKKLVPEEYKYYFDKDISLEDIVASGYRKTDIDLKIERANNRRASFNDLDIIREIYQRFEVGKSYTKKEMKTILQDIFASHNVCVKASDIKNYFEISRAQIKDPATNKYNEGFKLIKKLNKN